MKTKIYHANINLGTGKVLDISKEKSNDPSYLTQTM
jgi:hypothetical protein